MQGEHYSLCCGKQVVGIVNMDTLDFQKNWDYTDKFPAILFPEQTLDSYVSVESVLAYLKKRYATDNLIEIQNAIGRDAFKEDDGFVFKPYTRG